MKKAIKIGFPILCVAVIGGTFILLNKTTERINKNRLPDDEDKLVETQIDETETTEETITTTTTVTSEEAKTQEIKNKAKAIDIIKKSAPSVSNSYCTNEGIAGGKYLVAIRDNTSKEVKIYYAVDVEKETFEIYVK